MVSRATSNAVRFTRSRRPSVVGARAFCIHPPHLRWAQWMPPRRHGGHDTRGPPTRVPRRPHPSAPWSRTPATSDRRTPMRPPPPRGLEDSRDAAPPPLTAWRPPRHTVRTCSAATVATARRATSASMAATRNVDRRRCAAGHVDGVATAAAPPTPRPPIRAPSCPPVRVARMAYNHRILRRL